MINLDRLDEYEVISVDVETTGVHWYRDKMFGIAMAGLTVDGQYHSDYWDLRTKPRMMKLIGDALRKTRRVPIVNHSIKFDANFMLASGMYFPLDRMQCTMVRAALINEHEPSFELNALGLKYLGMGKVDIYQELADMFGGKPTRDAQIRNLHRAPESVARKYVIEDPVLAIKLWQWQEEEIERQELHRVWNLERKLTPILVQIERRGVRVDEVQAEQSMGTVDNKIIKAQSRLDGIINRPVNANSPKQMRELFGVVKTPDEESPKGYVWLTDSGVMLPMTDAGEASLAKDTLVTMAEQGDKRAREVLTLRKMIKARSFLKDHILGHSVDGRVYPNYNQMRGDKDFGTRTGRFSINDPALQQIPARDVDIAEIVRSCFIPEEGGDWCCADWAQFEFRWFAHYTKDPNILRAYHEDPDTDYHQIVSNLTGIPRKPRFAGDANAKQINLGMVFGMGKGKMAYEMGLDYSVRYGDDGREWFRAGPAAEKVFDTYHSAIPGVAALLAEASSIARARGYVKTVMERHLRFPGGKAVHKAAGLVFQGTSADCMKQKMIELWSLCEAEGAPMLLSVHDELNFSVPKQKRAVAGEIKRVLEVFDGVECPIKCRVPIKSSIELGPNWFIASK